MNTTPRTLLLVLLLAAPATAQSTDAVRSGDLAGRWTGKLGTKTVTATLDAWPSLGIRLELEDQVFFLSRSGQVLEGSLGGTSSSIVSALSGGGSSAEYLRLIGAEAQQIKAHVDAGN